MGDHGEILRGECSWTTTRFTPMSASASPAKLSTASHTEKPRCTLLCYLRTLNHCGSLTVNGSAEEKEAPMQTGGGARDQLLQF